VRELIRKQVFEQPVGSVFHLNLRFPWLRVMRQNSRSLDLKLVTGRTVVVPMVCARCGVIGERMRPSARCVVRRVCTLYAGRLHVRRSKRGTPSVHPIQGDELRALRRLQREQPPGPHVFCSERGGPIAPKSFHTLISRLGERAGMAFPIHPHMLAMAAAMRWPTPGTTRGPFKIGWGTARFSIPCVTPSCRRRGSKTSGATRR
jgi:hypothetical protein